MFENISSKFQEIFKNVRGWGRLSEKNVSTALRQVRLALLEADVNYRVVKEIVERTKRGSLGEKVIKSLNPGQQFIKLIHDKLIEIMTDPRAELKLAGSPAVIILAGLQGSGKTTVAAKLALSFRKKGRAPLLVAGDVRRPAAVRQLEVLGKKAGVETFSGRGNSALTIARDAIKYARSKKLEPVILDTAGRLHVDRELMKELGQLKRALRPDELLLVLDAMTGNDAVNIAREFEEKVGIDGAVLTKLDGDARGGAAISFREVTGKPIKLVGLGERLEDLQPFDPARMASRILGMGDVLSLVEKAEEAFQQARDEEWERKWRKASFDLEDFRRQLGQFKKMGPVDSLMDLLPVSVPRPEGGARNLKRMEAILDSMTPGERAHPEIINGSRRQRIARGSGTSVPEINQLLKQFNMAKKMIGKIGKSGGKKMKLGGVNWPLR